MRALPSVSVCIPVYRGEQFLAETIRSVLDQTYRDFELVILDNASPDDSGRIARSFGDRRIRVETNATTLPQPENWREVVRLCRGPLIKLVCADDLLHPRCLEYQVGPDGGRPRARGGRRPPAHDRRAQPGARPPPRPDRADGGAVQRRGRPARRAQRREPDRRARRGAVPPRALLRRRRLASRPALRHGPRPVDPAAAARASSSACPRPSRRSASARRACRPTTRPTIYAEQKAYIEELAATPHLQVRKTDLLLGRMRAPLGRMRRRTLFRMSRRAARRDERLRLDAERTILPDGPGRSGSCRTSFAVDTAARLAWVRGHPHGCPPGERSVPWSTSYHREAPGPVPSPIPG